jgi:hypothetical protein
LTEGAVQDRTAESERDVALEAGTVAVAAGDPAGDAWWHPSSEFIGADEKEPRQSREGEAGRTLDMRRPLVKENTGVAAKG